MDAKHLNIVSFTIPFPANYGGVIDVYHKLVALHTLGVKIHLHCFQYDREPARELEAVCESIHYYRRETGIGTHFSLKPYIVQGRNDKALLDNLLKNDYPVLFEGLHSCYFLSHPRLKGRLLIYRESNIEHHYYYHLCKAEKNKLHQLFFLVESLKLRLYQPVLKHAGLMLAVSEKDTEYLQHHFRHHKVHYLPSFHGNVKPSGKTGSGDYVLYHGNLAVAENSLAAEYLIREVFEGTGIKLVIAGLNPPQQLLSLADQKGVTVIPNASKEQMDILLQNAHVNILITFQATGLKLKLLNTLFNGRHVLVNSSMLSGTGLDELCHIADSTQAIRDKLKSLMDLPFSVEANKQRSKVLMERYSDEVNAQKLYQFLFSRETSDGI